MLAGSSDLPVLYHSLCILAQWGPHCREHGAEYSGWNQVSCLGTVHEHYREEVPSFDYMVQLGGKYSSECTLEHIGRVRWLMLGPLPREHTCSTDGECYFASWRLTELP